MIIDEEDYLKHYGILRRSGRYPWGSGQDSYERSNSFLGMVKELRDKGLTDTQIAEGFGMTTSELRNTTTIARNAKKKADISQAQRLKDHGYSNVAIGEKMGINESSVRSLLAPGKKDRADVLETTSNMLKDQVDEKGYIDIGSGVENHLGVSQTKLGTAVAMLKDQGYEVHRVKVEQLGTGHQTEVKVLCPPGTTQKEVWQNRDNIRQITEFSEDGGRSFLGLKTPINVDAKRVGIRYAEDGGTDADGVIYVRPGVDDISLGGSHYAQVRVAVDGTHYLKGMAMYKDDLPDGVDLMFNTNKSPTGNKLDAMKELKRDKDGNIDLDNPFGSAISRQIVDHNGNLTSAMNLVNEEGDWANWSKNLSSQMLSKQSHQLAEQQLGRTYQSKRDAYEEIMGLTNPAVKRKLLNSFADDADAASVHLKAAHINRQASHVILPVNSLKENEIYAPNYRPGERVVLIRYPHGGTFEIPELTVNNKHPEARKLLGNAPDAVGIHSKVAERLSGADFDGDTVLVIPNNNHRVKTSPALGQLKDFDPKAAYPAYEGMKKMSPRTKQVQMGDVSNLITDMTIKGAHQSEIARAVRHSMVVIDAEKHNLNYKQSAIDNGISALKKKYQGSAKSGASTLISRATSETRVPERKQSFTVDKTTGKKIYKETGATYTDKNGRVHQKTTKSQKLAETDNAFTLSSGTQVERVYAEHSNRLKHLANEARKASVNTKSTPYSPSAKAAYSNEVRSLDDKLNLALRNRPLERQAQIIANTVYRAKKEAYPEMDAAEQKKVKAQALQEARNRTHAGKEHINITSAEWDAIQAGAITNHKLTQILDNSDLDQVKKLATPKTATVMTASKKARAQRMLASGTHTQADVADALGVSLSTLKRSFE